MTITTATSATLTHYDAALTAAYTVSVRETREKPEIVVALVDLPASQGADPGLRNVAEVRVVYQKGQGYFVHADVWTLNPRPDGCVVWICSSFSAPQLSVMVESSKRYSAKVMMAIAVQVPHDAALHARLVAFLEAADVYFRNK